MNISLTDGTFLEFGIDFRPARGADDMEREKAECETDEQFAACIHAYVQREETQRHPEQRELTDDETTSSQQRLEDALGETFKF